MCVTQVWGAEPDYTLDTSLSENVGTNNNYTGNCDVEVDNITWNVNGNSTMSPWRLGGKSITNTDRTVYSKTAYASAVSRIDLTIGKAESALTGNSIKLYYSTNSNFSGATEISKPFSSASTITFEADFPKNAYYKFVINVTVSGTNNKYVQFSKVEIYNAEDDCTDPATALSITSAATATVGTPLSLTTSGGNGGTVTWSVTNGTGTATVDGSTLNPTTAGTVTVKAHQDLNGTTCEQDAEQTVTISKQAATITLSEVGVETAVSGTYYVGDSYTLPSTTSASSGDKVFVGWSTVTIPIPSAKPASNYYAKGESVTLEATNKFYAVFAKATGGTVEAWEKITSAEDVVAGTYAIISFDEAYYVPNAEATSAGPSATAVPKTDGKMDVTDDMKWTLSVSDNKYILESASASGKYLWGANTNDGIRISATSGKTSAFNEWKLESNTDYGLILRDTKTLSRYLSTYGTSDWRNYGSTNLSSTNRAANLYKLVGGVTYSEYCTTVGASHTLSSAVTPAASGSVELSSTTVSEGGTATATATPATGYTFTSWAITGTGATLSSTTANPTTITMGTTDATVTATFTAKTQYTVTFKNNGETLAVGGTKQVYAGEAIGTLPVLTSGDACDATSTTFMGWTEAEISTKQNEAPTMITAETVINEAKTYNAVWAKEQ